jgi:hypothetical protein
MAARLVRPAALAHHELDIEDFATVRSFFPRISSASLCMAWIPISLGLLAQRITP